MTFRPASEIPVTLLPNLEQEHFRLFELPLELLASFTSEDAPTLQLKSTGASASSLKDSHVVLCTHDRTYDLRQVSTSNSVYLTRPTSSGIQAVAKCDSTMEILSTSKASADVYIQSMLPTYSSIQHVDSHTQVTKQDLFSNIPLSETECNTGWLKLACFELSDSRGCFIPSAEVRVQVWDSLMTAALAERLDLATCSANDVLNSAREVREDWPIELVSGIIDSVTSRGSDDGVVFDADKCVHFVGANKLQVTSKRKSTDTADFMTTWKDAVPEQWRIKCRLSSLQEAYKLSDSGGNITFASPTEFLANGSSSTSDQNVKAALSSKRNWHEKFRASKKS